MNSYSSTANLGDSKIQTTICRRGPPVEGRETDVCWHHSNCSPSSCFTILQTLYPPKQFLRLLTESPVRFKYRIVNIQVLFNKQYPGIGNICNLRKFVECCANGKLRGQLCKTRIHTVIITSSYVWECSAVFRYRDMSSHGGCIVGSTKLYNSNNKHSDAVLC